MNTFLFGLWAFLFGMSVGLLTDSSGFWKYLMERRKLIHEEKMAHIEKFGSF